MSVKSMPSVKPKRAYNRRRPPTPGPPPKRKYQRKSVCKELHSTSLPTMTELQSLQQAIPASSTPLKLPFKTNGFVDRRPSNGPPSAIKMRINYNKESLNSSKEAPAYRASTFATTTAYKLSSTPVNGISRLNATNSGCLNCSKFTTGLSDSMLTNVSSHRDMLPMMAGGGSCNREEFYKYLGIDTNPMPDKTTSSQQTSPLDTATAYNHRRSLRVFIQQRQNEFSRLSKSPDKSATLQSPTRTKDASPSDSMKRRCALDNDLRLDLISGSLLSLTSISPPSQPNGLVKAQSASSISSHIRQRYSYDPAAAIAALVQQQSSASTLSATATTTAAAAVVNNGARSFTNDSLTSTANQIPQPNNVLLNEAIASTSAADPANKPSPSPSNRLNSRRDSLDRTRLLRTQKRKVLLPSPMMLTEMFKRYKQCFRQGFAMQKQLRQHMKNMTKVQATDADANQPESNGTMTNIQIPVTNTSQQNDDTHADASTAGATEFVDLSCEDLNDAHFINPSGSAIVVNSKSNNGSAAVAQLPPPPAPPSNITLSSSESNQWNRDLAKRVDKVQFHSPLDPMHGAVLAILTHSTSPTEDDVIVVIQETQISYWYSTAKILCMFGIARSWIRVSSIARVCTGTDLEFLSFSTIFFFISFWFHRFFHTYRQRSRCIVSASFDRCGRTISRVHWDESQRIAARWIPTMLSHVRLSQCVFCQTGRKSTATNCTRTRTFGYD